MLSTALACPVLLRRQILHKLLAVNLTVGYCPALRKPYNAAAAYCSAFRKLLFMFLDCSGAKLMARHTADQERVTEDGSHIAHQSACLLSNQENLLA